jgi:hypothetical protein
MHRVLESRISSTKKAQFSSLENKKSPEITPGIFYLPDAY